MRHEVRGTKAFTPNLIVFIFLSQLRIIFNIDRWINRLKADGGEKVLKQYWTTKEFYLCHVLSHLSLEIYSSQEQDKIRYLCVKTGTVTCYVDNFSKTSDNYVAIGIFLIVISATSIL
ncbi:MAG: hypothetical protein V7K92_22545 [Nostoc sp.]|uniref:hypothetical protein n=1 Tax=Nostoc sp. TaxID=1180 RepID=UPI002FF42B5C